MNLILHLLWPNDLFVYVPVNVYFFCQEGNQQFKEILVFNFANFQADVGIYNDFLKYHYSDSSWFPLTPSGGKRYCLTSADSPNWFGSIPTISSR